MNEDNDKFLPNFIVFICYVLIAASIVVILGHNTITNLYTRDNIEHSINEVNIFQIPLEQLIDSDLFGEKFKLKDHNVYDLVLYVSKENSISANAIKDILADTRLNNNAYKNLYSTIKENYFSPNDTNELIEKIIEEHEFKNGITLPQKLKDQLSTIMLSYVRLLSDMSFASNEKAKENFFICYSVFIAALVITAAVLVISIVTKDKVLALKKVGLFGTIIAALTIIYSLIQEAMFVVLQYKFASYSYAVDGLGTLLFKSLFFHGLLLLFIGILLLLFAKDFISLDREIKVGKKNKEEKPKKEKIVKEKKERKFKLNFKLPKREKKEKTKKEEKKPNKKKKDNKFKINFNFLKKDKKKNKKKKKTTKKKKNVKKTKVKKERKKIDFSKLKESLSKVNTSYLNLGSIFKKKDKDDKKEQ